MPVRTNVDVMNAALDLLGTQVMDTVSDTTKEARIMVRNYDSSRMTVLRMHPWNFAIVRVILDGPNMVLPGPVFQFTNRFYLPVDFLRLISLNEGDDDANEWHVEGRSILTNDSTLNVKYLKNHTEVDDWDPIFFDTLAAYLAAKCCYSITGSNAMQEQLMKLFRTLKAPATQIDSSEDPSTILDIDVWMRSRVGPSQGFVRDPQT